MVIIVNRKPRDVCRVSMVPRYSVSQSSEMQAENCAESATTENPHTRQTARRMDGFPPYNAPARTAHEPLIVIERIVTVVRPILSARYPARTQPAPPQATTAKAPALAQAG